MMFSRQGGFGLQEMLVVVFVLSILAIFGLRSFGGPQTKGQVAEAKARLDTSATKLSNWGSQAGGFTGLTDNDAAQAKVIVGEEQWVVMSDEINEVVQAPALGVFSEANGRYAVLRSCVEYFRNGSTLCLTVRVNPFAAGGGGLEREVWCPGCAQPIYTAAGATSGAKTLPRFASFQGWPQSPAQNAP